MWIYLRYAVLSVVKQHEPDFRFGKTNNWRNRWKEQVNYDEQIIGRQNVVNHQSRLVYMRSL